ncbi:MAG TPA: polyprenyl synthetase family protein [Anaerolineales bacterium]|nr:polyprenyl synthetase family protein [Anaerolineales bacterium]
MDNFSQVVHEFSVLPCMDSWPEAQTLFQQAASREPNHWLIPLRACEAVGGTQEQAIPAMLAVACVHVGILLVDDMLDADPRGDYHRMGMPAVSNLACAFQAAALSAINGYSQDPTSRLAALNSFNEMFLCTAFGQFLDASAEAPADEPAYWRVIQTKSSPFFGAALQVGALAGGGTLKTAGQLKRLGCIYGEMIQIHDDMHDSMETPANPDWVQGRSPLPILFASLVNHPEQQRFRALSRSITEPAALQEAQEILIRCGAISYCVDQLLRKHQEAKEILDGIALVDDAPIASLLDEVIAPVHKLLEAVEQ